MLTVRSSGHSASENRFTVRASCTDEFLWKALLRQCARQFKIQMNQMMTPAAAEETGYHLIAPNEYGGEQITIDGTIFVRGADAAFSKTAWNQRGFKIKKGEKPFSVLEGRYRSYPIYRHDQVEPIARKKPKPTVTLPVTAENILRCIFAVNRSAKRYRDGAKNSYYKKAHGMAGQCRLQKDQLYTLKDLGIAYAFRQGWLAAEQHGELVLYSGMGYSFHSKLRPKELVISESSVIISNEAKPRGNNEPRIKDATATLNRLPDYRNQFLEIETNWYTNQSPQGRIDNDPQECEHGFPEDEL